MKITICRSSPPEIYEPTPDSTVELTLLQDLTVYTAQDLSSATAQLPAGMVVTLTGTDNRSWVRIWAEGEYWVYVSDGWNVQSGDQQLSPETVFDGLYWVG